MGLHGHRSHHLICQPRSRSRDVENSDPPLTGGGQRWQSGSIVGQETLPNMPSPTKKKGGTPLVHRGNCSHPLDWSQPATFLAVFAELSNMQKTFVSVKLSSLVLPYMCCRRQCSVQRAGSQGIQTTELFRTFQDVIVPEGPAVHCSTHRRRS